MEHAASQPDLHTAWVASHVAWDALHGKRCCRLHVARRMLHVARRMLHVARRMLHVARRTTSCPPRGHRARATRCLRLHSVQKRRARPRSTPTAPPHEASAHAHARVGTYVRTHARKHAHPRAPMRARAQVPRHGHTRLPARAAVLSCALRSLRRRAAEPSRRPPLRSSAPQRRAPSARAAPLSRRKPRR